MKFLRRLAPGRAAETGRAVAVLPSRFASESPLRANIGQPRTTPAAGDDETSWPDQQPARRGEETSLTPVAAPAPRAPREPPRPYFAARAQPPKVGNRSALQPHTVRSGIPSVAEAGQRGDEPVRRDDLEAPLATGHPARTKVPLATDRPARTEVTSATHLPAQAESFDSHADDLPDALQLRGQRSAHPAGTAQAELKSQGRTAAMGAKWGPIGASTPASPSRVGSPLSAASLAQRAGHAHDEDSVVHVTIGRIEVVANVAPTAAPRRSPAPRAPTVALSDYLRGGSGGRR